MCGAVLWEGLPRLGLARSVEVRNENAPPPSPFPAVGLNCVETVLFPSLLPSLSNDCMEEERGWAAHLHVTLSRRTRLR